MPSFLFVADPEMPRPYRYPETDVEGAVPYERERPRGIVLK